MFDFEKGTGHVAFVKPHHIYGLSLLNEMIISKPVDLREFSQLSELTVQENLIFVLGGDKSLI